jgi:tetratricopeptide (TPR) repeat protein
MDEAQRVVGRLIERFPDDPYAFDCAAKAQLYLGRTNQASVYWNRCLELDSQAAFAHEGLGRIALMRSDYDTAVAHFQEAMLLRPALADTTWLAETACQLADALTKLGKTEEAIEVLQKNIRACPDSAKSHLLLGQLLLQLREFQRAVASFEVAVRLAPRSSEAHFGLATALMRTGARDKSVQSMNTFRQLRTNKKAVRTRMKFQEAEPKELAEKVAMTCTHAAQVYGQHGDLPEAERSGRRATMLSEKNVASRVFLADHYARSRRPDKALDLYRELTTIEPDNPQRFWQYAMLCVRLRRWESAETALETVVDLSPRHSPGYVALAELYLRTGKKLPEAKRCAEEAIRIEPVAPHYALLSRVCARTGDEAAAREAARKARELQDPGGPIQ